jgi:hypothetical protein
MPQGEAIVAVLLRADRLRGRPNGRHSCARSARADDGEVIPDPVEVAEARWITPEEFPTLTPIFEGDLEFFDSILPTLQAL